MSVPRDSIVTRSTALRCSTIQFGETEGTIRITIDFGPYIENYSRACLGSVVAQKEFICVQDELDELTRGVRGTILWDELLRLLIEKEKMGEDAQTEIQESAMQTIMKESFVEILKNAMDAVLLNACAKDGSSILYFDIALDLSNPLQIKLRFTDNGPGFTDEFLETINTRLGQETFVVGRGSKKETDRKRPPLFGGNGRGLRCLLARLLYGDDLIEAGVRSKKYEPNEQAVIVFSRREDGRSGAVIDIRTSREPFKLVATMVDSVYCESAKVVMKYSDGGGSRMAAPGMFSKKPPRLYDIVSDAATPPSSKLKKSITDSESISKEDNSKSFVFA